MKNQKLLQSDPADVAAVIRTNVHPYVYMTKYALKHFKEKRGKHGHKNALIYTSSITAWISFPFFSIYSSTKLHNSILASLSNRYVSKSEDLKGLVSIQAVHPSLVATKLVKGKTDPTCVTTSQCTQGALSDLPTESVTCGAPLHTLLSIT